MFTLLFNKISIFLFSSSHFPLPSLSSDSLLFLLLPPSTFSDLLLIDLLPSRQPSRRPIDPSPQTYFAEPHLPRPISFLSLLRSEFGWSGFLCVFVWLVFGWSLLIQEFGCLIFFFFFFWWGWLWLWVMFEMAVVW